jgi:PKD repeat protein
MRPTFYGQLPSVTAFAFSVGKLYYTMQSRAGLYYRLFNPESGIVSPEEFQVPGVTMPAVTGMFISGQSFYSVLQSTGDLRRRGFVNGAPTGAETVVSGPGTDGVDWRSRATFLGPGPAPRVNQPPTAGFTEACDALVCSFDGSSSADPDGDVASYAWDFGDGSTSTEVSPGHPYAAAGEYPVRLTVTDNEGATDTVVRTVLVQETPAVQVAYRGTSRTMVAQTMSASVAVPDGVTDGDGELLFITVSESVTVAAPTGLTGWQLVGSQASGTMSTTVYQRVGATGDSGRTVAVSTSANSKIILQLAAYGGTSTTAPVAAYAGAADAATASHRTPTLTVPAGGGWAVSFWADRSSTTTTWTAPPAVTTRDMAVPTVTGRVTSLLADSAAPVPAGEYGGLTATTNAASTRGVTMTVVLAPR